MPTYQHILAPIDFTPVTDSIVQRAQELADCYQARLSLLNVLEDIPLGDIAFGGTSKLAMPEDMKQQHSQRATERMRKLANNQGLSTDAALETTYTQNSASEAIIQFVKDHNVDLVIVGNHGKRGMLGILGSTAESTLKGVPCDIMAVRL